MQSHNEFSRIVAVGTGILILLVFLGGTKVVAGLFLGLLALGSFCLIYCMMPLSIRKFLAYFHVIVDIVFSIIAYRLMGAGTATALQGGAIVAIGVSLYLIRQRRILLGKDQQFDELMARL